MSVENEIFRHLSTSTSLTDNYSSKRIWPVTFPPNKLEKYPAIVYTRISGVRQNTLSGYSSQENPHFQIDCYATTYDAIKAMSTIVLRLMDAATAFHAYCISDYDIYEDEPDVFRSSMDFSVWYRT